MIKIGPEDPGKVIFIPSLRVTGRMTSYTAEHVWVISDRDTRAQRYPRSICHYANTHLFS